MTDTQRKKRIIFVDDESKVLSGLRRMLHFMRKEWDMTFATNSFDALEIKPVQYFNSIYISNYISQCTKVTQNFPCPHKELFSRNPL